MRLFYNLGIYIYNLLVWIAANFNEKAALFAKGRKKKPVCHVAIQNRPIGQIYLVSCGFAG